jgi:hypothetical protein
VSLRWFRPLVASLVVGLSAVPCDAAPLPIEGRLGVLAGLPFSSDTRAIGVDAELSWRDSPWTVGFLAWGGRSPGARTAWLRYAVPLGAGGRLGLVIGANDYIEAVGCGGFGPCEPPTQFGMLLAISYVLRTERLWLRLTPQYVVPIDGGRAYYPGYGKSGLPWAEVGMRAMPWLDFSVRFNETPFAATVVF